jgi:hypothetical protein
LGFGAWDLRSNVQSKMGFGSIAWDLGFGAWDLRINI